MLSQISCRSSLSLVKLPVRISTTINTAPKTTVLIYSQAPSMISLIPSQTALSPSFKMFQPFMKASING